MGVLVSDLAGYSGTKGADRWPAIVALALAVASCLPVIVARYPQMSDYPAHLARYHVMLDGGHSPWLAHWYFFQWAWSGNVGVDLLIRPFAAVFGLEMGGRVITGLIVVLTGLGLMAAEWALRRRISAACLLAFAFIWSPMMLIGMLNFGLGQMVALWTFALWVAMGNCAQALRWRPLVMLPLGLVCWGCHISAWGILGIMVFGFEWSRTRDWRSFLAPWPLTLPILVMALLPTTHGEMSYGPVWYLYKQAIWLKAMRDLCTELDILMVVDEVITGFGRTGPLFACEAEGVVPDLMTVAKGLTSGYSPMGAVLLSSRFYRAMADNAPGGSAMGHGFTYSGHPVSAAVGLEVMRLYLEGGILANGQRVGAYFERKLEGLAGHPLIGDIRSRGMLAGVELVTDKAARTRPAADLGLPDHLARIGYANGLLFRAFGDSIVGFAPPLICTEAEIDLLIERFTKTLDDVLAIPAIGRAVA